jgi:Putative transposase
VAISNRRLLALEKGQVSFAWKDYREGGKDKVMTLSAEEFIRRFLQHALPPGFQHIRFYGFLANCHRVRKLELCRQLLDTPAAALLPTAQACQDWLRALCRMNLRRCPHCGVGILARIQWLSPVRIDTS